MSFFMAGKKEFSLGYERHLNNNLGKVGPYEVTCSRNLVDKETERFSRYSSPDVFSHSCTCVECLLSVLIVT